MTLRSAGFVLDREGTPPGLLVRHIWEARQLLLTLARRDFFVRYRRASFGVLWAVGLPLFQAAVLTVVFSFVLKIHTRVAYPAFVYSGMIGWGFFSAGFSTGATSIVDNTGLANRVYFPRAVLPLVPVASGLYSFAISLVLLLAICLAFGVHLGLALLWLAPAVVLMVSLTAAFALLVSALHVYFRDLRFIVQAALMAWFYVTPVFYPLERVGDRLRLLIELNPVTGVVELFRQATSVGADPQWQLAALVSCAWIMVVGVAALLVHARYDRVFSDLM